MPLIILVQLACGCTACQKTSGTPRSFSLLLTDQQFTVVSGTPKEYSRKGDSGNNVTYYNCVNCCTLLYVRAEVRPGTNILKMGTLDQPEEMARVLPQSEVYTRNYPPWCEAIKGASQAD